MSLKVAPPTRTRSVLKNRALAAAYAGAHRFGIEVFEPGTSNTLMAALLVHDLNAGTAAARAPVAGRGVRRGPRRSVARGLRPAQRPRARRPARRGGGSLTRPCPNARAGGHDAGMSEDADRPLPLDGRARRGLLAGARRAARDDDPRRSRRPGRQGRAARRSATRPAPWGPPCSAHTHDVLRVGQPGQGVGGARPRRRRRPGPGARARHPRRRRHRELQARHDGPARPGLRRRRTT